jgi:transcriptional regulator GlxA family with amidase domain
MRVAVLALEGVFDTGLAAVLDTLSTANELAAMQGHAAPPFELQVVGTRARVHSAQGLRVPVRRADQLGRADWLVLLALGTKMPEPLLLALQRPDVRDALGLLRQVHADGAGVAAACIGSFVLAESGLLDGHEATTTWWLAPLFRQRFPQVRLDASRMVIASGRFATSGAALSHMDMALWLVRQVSPELAALCARYLIVDSRPSQSVYAISDHLAHADPLVERFDRWVRDHLHQPIELDAAAAALGTSKRTLARRLQEVLGKSPIDHVRDLRVERAVHLLKTSSQSVDRIAEQVGYADGVTLRTLLRQRLRKGVREIRAD